MEVTRESNSCNLATRMLDIKMGSKLLKNLAVDPDEGRPSVQTHRALRVGGGHKDSEEIALKVFRSENQKMIEGLNK
jgi:hypothetical protein